MQQAACTLPVVPFAQAPWRKPPRTRLKRRTPSGEVPCERWPRADSFAAEGLAPSWRATGPTRPARGRRALTASAGTPARPSWRTRSGARRATDEGADSREGRIRYRAIFISDCHLGTPGCQAAALLDFLRAHRIRLPVPRRRHHRRLAVASAAGIGIRCTTTSCRRCCARRARGPRSSTSRAITTRPRAITSASTSAASRSAKRPCTSRATAAACW